MGREAGRPGNSEDRQPTQAALADNNPHERSIGDGPLYSYRLGEHTRTSPLPSSKDTSTNNPYHSTHFPVQSMLYNLKIVTYPKLAFPGFKVFCICPYKYTSGLI